MERPYVVEVYSSVKLRDLFKKDKRWYWRIVAPNGETVADGSEAYDSKGNAMRAVKKLLKADFYIPGSDSEE